jgi:hypothetical protein
VDPTTATTPPVTGTCTMDIGRIPGHTAVGNATVQLVPVCTFPWTSDHVAAHFASTSSDNASLTHYTTACQVLSGGMGDSFNTTCAFPANGTYYVRGHAIIMNGGEAQHFWSPEYMVVVLSQMPEGASGAPTVTVYNLRSYATAGQNYTFRVESNWAIAEPVESTHMGAHWGNMSHATGSVANYPGAPPCSHVTGPVPGSFQTSCNFDMAGTMYVRGHVRLTHVDPTEDYFSPEFGVTVRA